MTRASKELGATITPPDNNSGQTTGCREKGKHIYDLGFWIYERSVPSDTCLNSNAPGSSYGPLRFPILDLRAPVPSGARFPLNDPLRFLRASTNPISHTGGRSRA